MAAVLNYKVALMQVDPPIDFSVEMEGDQICSTTTYDSLGFKQIVYSSEYGRNYCERIPFWKKADWDVDTLSYRQYEELMKEMTGRMMKACAELGAVPSGERCLEMAEKRDMIRIYSLESLY